MTEKKKVIILTGPTAVGKTELSIKLAKEIGGEIISADSMQVYRNMDIGSAKISNEEMDGVKHHLLDILDPSEEFNVVIFQKAAKAAMEDIFSRGKIPIFTGGTGFYIQAVIYDIDFTENNDDDNSIRQHYEKIAREEGSAYLHHLLQEKDAEAARQIHENNSKRIIRALEYFDLTGERISEHNEVQSQKTSPYDVYYFVLTDDREKIYQRINDRVDAMFDAGLIQEVQKLLDAGCKRHFTSMQGLGYKEVIDYLAGDLTLEEAKEKIKRDTRHFAKRQLTWFRREKDVIWLEKNIPGQTSEDLVKKILTMTGELKYD